MDACLIILDSWTMIFVKKVDHCFDKAFEKASLDLLLEHVILSVLARIVVLKNRPGQLDHDICLADFEKKVDHCFDKAFGKVSFDLLLEDVILSVLARIVVLKNFTCSPLTQVLFSTLQIFSFALPRLFNLLKHY